MKLYRIYLPKYYSKLDGSLGEKVDIKELRKITKEIQDKFHGCSYNPRATLPFIQGMWEGKEKQVYKEPMFLVELFIEDTFKNQEWIQAKKILWKLELKQEELFIIVQNADIV